MLQNYLTTALRALARNKVFAGINILGLAIGMAACILLLLFVRHETSYDRWLPEHERAFQVQRFDKATANSPAQHTRETAYVVGRTLAADFPEIEAVAFLAYGEPVVLQNGVARTGRVLMADPAFLDIVRLPLRRGNRPGVLRELHSVLLTQSEAARRFPGRDPIGQTLTMVRNGNAIDYKVTGVLADLPKNSHLVGDMLIPYDRVAVGFPDRFYTNFGWNSGFNYLRLRPGASRAAVMARMAAWEKRHIPSVDIGGVTMNQGNESDWYLTPVADIHLGAAKGGLTPGNDRGTIVTFALVAALILAMAAINFINLATARAGQRAREVALRKVVGASRKQLIVQFLGESLLVALIAGLVALSIVELAVAPLSGFLDADLGFAYLGAGGLLLPVVALIVAVGLAAGLYPALVLSRFDPAPVLKANRSGPDGGGLLRNSLVIAQFAVSIALIICTAVVAAQTHYARTSDAGYNRAGLLQVTGIARKQVEPIADRLIDAIRRVPGVIAAGRTNLAVAAQNQSSTFVRIIGNPQPVNIGTYNLDPETFAALGLRPVAGRLLSRDNPRDNGRMSAGDSPTDAEQLAFAARGVNIVINTDALAPLGFASAADAVGTTIRTSSIDERLGLVPATIVGVVPGVRMRSIRDPAEPAMFSWDGSYFTDLLVRVRVGEAGAVRDRVAAVWQAYAAQVPFDARFADEIVARQYDADEARATIFAAFAGLAIIVACLGLYGLAAFTAERRTREIGIRKVLGARTSDIVRLLVWQFSQPVLLANLIAWPVAWWLMRGWLDGFAARIDLGLGWFIAAGAAAAAIAAITIIGHALRVARQSPALALRYE